MKTNTTVASRIFRAVVGLGLISLAFVGPKTPLGFIGFIPLAVALVGHCPMYSICPKLQPPWEKDSDAGSAA